MPLAIPELASQSDISALATLVAESNLIALALADHERLLFANAAFGCLFGRPAGLTDVSLLDLLVPADRERVGAALRSAEEPPPTCVATASRGEHATFEVELHCERVTCEHRALLAIFAQDITDRFRTEAQLNLLAYSDPLTGLPNRAMFADRIRQAAMASRRTGRGFSVIMLDLDGFKAVNDAHGHDAGDLVLRRVASRLQAGLRDSDTAARLGGDEFAVLLPDLAIRAAATAVAERLVGAASQPIALRSSNVRVGASAGIACYPEHAVTVDQLLSAADAALYAAKRRGRGCVEWAVAALPEETTPELLTWTAALDVGMPEIDEQHAKLAGLLNKLAVALRNGEDHIEIFREIIHYTAFHFATEERLMQACHYDGAASHEDMHRRLLDDLRSLRLEKGVSLSVGLTLRYLQEWLLRHVDGADRDLAAALRAARLG